MNCSLKPSNKPAATTEGLTGQPRRPGKFSGRYGPHPTNWSHQIWRMPWDCWLEYSDDQMLLEAWNAATEEFSENWPSTAVHLIQGA